MSDDRKDLGKEKAEGLRGAPGTETEREGMSGPSGGSAPDAEKPSEPVAGTVGKKPEDANAALGRPDPAGAPARKAETGGVKQVTETAGDGEQTAPRKPAAAAAGRARPAAGARPRPAAAKKEEKPEEPSPMQPLLDKFAAIIREKVGPDAVEEALINRPSGHVPTLVIRKESWLDTARLLRDDPELAFDYLRLMSSVDYQTHLEVVYQFYSFRHGHQLAVRVKTDREEAVVPSVSKLWKAAGWNEREVWDLMGIRFDGHPDLRRILLPDDWVGHPLRKDYEPLDQEV